MAKTIALMACLAASITLTLGNFYHTYGIWPKSWWAFFGFAVAQVVVYGLTSLIAQEK